MLWSLEHIRPKTSDTIKIRMNKKRFEKLKTKHEADAWRIKQAEDLLKEMGYEYIEEKGGWALKDSKNNSLESEDTK